MNCVGHKQRERLALELVNNGQLIVDEEGRIWRKKSGRRAEQGTGYGYLQVKFYLKEKRYFCSAHRLVWQVTHGDIPLRLCINHINGIKDDNRPSNLEVVSYSGNLRHAYKQGLKQEFGESNPACSVPDALVQEIRERYATGFYTQGDLADMFSLTFQAVSRYIRGESRPRQSGPTSIRDHRFCAVDHDPATGRFVGRMLDGRTHDDLAWETKGVRR